MKFEMAKNESTVDSFEHFVGVRYTDDASILEFETTRVMRLCTRKCPKQLTDISPTTGLYPAVL